MEEKKFESEQIIQEDFSIQTPLKPGTIVSCCCCEGGIMKLKVHHS